MSKPRSFLRVFTEAGPLVALAVAIALLRSRGTGIILALDALSGGLLLERGEERAVIAAKPAESAAALLLWHRPLRPRRTAEIEELSRRRRHDAHQHTERHRERDQRTTLGDDSQRIFRRHGHAQGRTRTEGTLDVVIADLGRKRAAFPGINRGRAKSSRARLTGVKARTPAGAIRRPAGPVAQ